MQYIINKPHCIKLLITAIGIIAWYNIIIGIIASIKNNNPIENYKAGDFQA